MNPTRVVVITALLAANPISAAEQVPRARSVQLKAAYCVPVLEGEVADLAALQSAADTPPDASAPEDADATKARQLKKKGLAKFSQWASMALAAHREVLAAVKPGEATESLAAAHDDGVSDVERLTKVRACVKKSCTIEPPATEPRQGCAAACLDEPLNLRMISCKLPPGSPELSFPK